MAKGTASQQGYVYTAALNSWLGYHRLSSHGSSARAAKPSREAESSLGQLACTRFCAAHTTASWFKAIAEHACRSCGALDLVKAHRRGGRLPSCTAHPTLHRLHFPWRPKCAHPPPLHHLVSRRPKDYRILESKMRKDTRDDISQR